MEWSWAEKYVHTSEPIRPEDPVTSIFMDYLEYKLESTDE